MKKTLVSCLLMLSIMLAFAQKKSEKDLGGKWVSVEYEGLGLIFLPHYRVQLMIPDAPNATPPIDYKAGFSKDPIPVQMIIPRRGETLYLKSEISFINDSTIQWKVFPGSVPLPFNGPKDASGAVNIILKHLSEGTIAQTKITSLRTEADLIGNWVLNMNDKTHLAFSGDHKATISQNNDEIPMTYTVDFSQTPGLLELSLTDGTNTYAIKSEITFLNNDLIKLKVFTKNLPIPSTEKPDKDGAVVVVFKRS